MKFIDYIGSKKKLENFLEENMISNFDKNRKYLFIDGFAGTTFVSNKIVKETNWDVILFDIAKYVDILASIINPSVDKNKIERIVKSLNILKGEPGEIFNELSVGGKPKSILNKEETFKGQSVHSRMFFSKEVGQKIDRIKRVIFSLSELTEEERKILLLFLLNYADRNANTTSVYGAYLKNQKKEEQPFLNHKILEAINEQRTNKVSVSIGDINDNLRNIKTNFSKNEVIIYLDPPYNTRKYESNYHVLNYLIKEDFSFKDIKLNSKTAMPINQKPNPFGSKKNTLKAFKEMILNSLEISNNIFISYNDEGIVSEEDMKELSKELGFNLKTIYQNYKKFTSGERRIDKKKRKEVREILWIISNS
jgi:adenine-specific DNA-methyltransferase